MLAAVAVRERPRHHVPVPEPRRVGERLEQPPPDDLEPFLGAGRPPRRFDAPDDVAQPVDRLAAALAAHFDVVGLRVRRTGGVGRRQADHQQAIAGRLHRFGQRLREGELRLEAPGRQVALIVQLARVGDPLVDQDQARPVLDEKLLQHVAGARRALVVGRDARVRRRAPQLPRQLAPQRPHHRAVRLGDGIARRDADAHQDHPAHRRRRRGAGLPQQRVDAGQLARRGAGKEVVQGEHRVGLAAAEVGLQLHHRIAGRAGQPPHRAGEHALQALGQEAAPEELDRVVVLVGALSAARPRSRRPPDAHRLARRGGPSGAEARPPPGVEVAQVHLPQVRRELRLLVAAAGHVLVRRHHLAPRFQGRGPAPDGQSGLPPPFAARLLVEAHAQQFHLEPVDFRRLRRRHRREQPAGRVEGAVGVVPGERLLMRPAVPVAPQLAHESALGRPEDRAERLVPRLPHQLEERGGVPLGHPPLPDVRIVDEGPQRRRPHPLRLDRALHLAVDERAEPRFQQLERLADAFVVGRRHAVSPAFRYALLSAAPPTWPAGPSACS